MKPFTIKVKDETEARIVIALCEPIDGDREEEWDECAFLRAVQDGFEYSKGTLRIYSPLLEDCEELTLEELFDYARRGFEEPRWKPEKGEGYVLADPTLLEYYRCYVWADSLMERGVYERGLVFKKTEEDIECAIKCAKKMLAAIEEK